MTSDRTGRIVWHDLFTSDRTSAMAFYRALAGWNYVTENATDFAWGRGAQDYVLALMDAEAGAGLIERPPGMAAGWIAYVEVEDVDATARLAESQGGAVLRPPFDVPGVGRNALLRDPQGARIGIALSRHDFPRPQKQFGPELYLTNGRPFPEAFYTTLFNWMPGPVQSCSPVPQILHRPSGTHVATRLIGPAHPGWVPGINVVDPTDAAREAEAFNGTGDIPELTANGGHFIRDSDGLLVHLSPP